MNQPKAHLAEGRLQTQAIRSYLELLPFSRGPKKDPETIQQKVVEARTALARTIDPIERLHLTQNIINLEGDIRNITTNTNHEALEEDFIEHAAAYSVRKAITWEAWRAMGVPPNVLTRAGVRRKGSA